MSTENGSDSSSPVTLQFDIKSGRPRKFDTVEQMQAVIDEYFVYCDSKTKEVHTEKLGDMIMPDPEPYTMSGLALALGFDSRQSLLNYESRKDDKGQDFLDTIKRARMKVESDLDRRLNHRDTFTPGLIFNLKNNFNYKDKTETEQSGVIEVVTRKAKK